MIGSLAALAAAASTALVGAMATDAWAVARRGVLRVLGRGGGAGAPEPAEPAGLAAQLDGEAALVGGADDPEAARRSLQPAWGLRLEHFLRAHPEAAEELRELTEQVTAELPRAGQQWVQHVVARDHSQVFAVQGGNVILHQEPHEQPQDRQSHEQSQDRQPQDQEPRADSDADGRA